MPGVPKYVVHFPTTASVIAEQCSNKEQEYMRVQRHMRKNWSCKQGDRLKLCFGTSRMASNYQNSFQEPLKGMWSVDTLISDF